MTDLTLFDIKRRKTLEEELNCGGEKKIEYTKYKNALKICPGPSSSTSMMPSLASDYKLK